MEHFPDTPKKVVVLRWNMTEKRTKDFIFIENYTILVDKNDYDELANIDTPECAGDQFEFDKDKWVRLCQSFLVKS